MNFSLLHRYPYIRLLIPWMAGVFCGDHFFDAPWSLLFGILFFVFSVVLLLISFFFSRYSQRGYFGLSLFLLFFAGGSIGITMQMKEVSYAFPKQETIYRVQLTDTPRAKERSYSCTAFLKEGVDSLGATYPIEREVLLYLAKDTLTVELKAGDELLISSHISKPTGGGNFDEFDYARYLFRKGVSGTGYVASGKWKLTGFTRVKMHEYREGVLSLYRQLGFQGDGLAVLAALTVGNQAELSAAVLQSYSVAGASHVLSLSGLHIGLLYGLLLFLLSPLRKRGSVGRMFTSLILLLLLWTFAVFTGLAPSVVRSVCMFSLLALAQLFSRTSLTYNTLAATAWYMLLFYPAWLFDVGFQLSFLAVAFILLMQRPIYRLFPVKNVVQKYIAELLSVSVAAQLGTAPFVAYYFAQYSTHFWLTNLVVVPLASLILYAAVIMFLLTPFSSLQGLSAVAVNYLIEALNGFVRWVEQLPYASLKDLFFYPGDVLGCYLCLFSILFYYYHRRVRNLVVALAAFLLLGTYHTAMSWNDHPHDSIVFYNIRNCPAVHCVDSNGRSWIAYGDSLSDKRRLKQVASHYWNRLQLQQAQELTTDYAERMLSFHEHILTFHGCRIGMLTDNRWLHQASDAPLSVDYLYVGKGYDGHVKELNSLFHTSCVVLDSSLTDYRKRQLEAECQAFNIHYISLSDKGSVCFLL